MSQPASLKLHQVSGIYPDAETAQTVFERLRRHGYSQQQLSLIAPYDADVWRRPSVEVRSTEWSVAGRLLSGAVIGSAAGLAVAVGLHYLADTFLDSAPVFSHVVFALLGALIGGSIWCLRGMQMHAPESDSLVNEAVRHGHWAVTVVTRDGRAAEEARELISQTMLESEADQPVALSGDPKQK